MSVSSPTASPSLLPQFQSPMQQSEVPAASPVPGLESGSSWSEASASRPDSKLPTSPNVSVSTPNVGAATVPCAGAVSLQGPNLITWSQAVVPLADANPAPWPVVAVIPTPAAVPVFIVPVYQQLQPLSTFGEFHIPSTANTPRSTAVSKMYHNTTPLDTWYLVQYYPSYRVVLRHNPYNVHHRPQYPATAPSSGVSLRPNCSNPISCDSLSAQKSEPLPQQQEVMLQCEQKTMGMQQQEEMVRMLRQEERARMLQQDALMQMLPEQAEMQLLYQAPANMNELQQLDEPEGALLPHLVRYSQEWSQESPDEQLEVLVEAQQQNLQQ